MGVAAEAVGPRVPRLVTFTTRRERGLVVVRADARFPSAKSEASAPTALEALMDACRGLVAALAGGVA